jgi:hypothetical protein
VKREEEEAKKEGGARKLKLLGKVLGFCCARVAGCWPEELEISQSGMPYSVAEVVENLRAF